ncbi:MAG TPA: S8 family serine peptidase [Bryobacteraceae bacterium]|nr:S8 family serine peptidase [Bryobacteraceae bacterium]
MSATPSRLRIAAVAALILAPAPALFGQAVSNGYAVILEDVPVTARFTSRDQIRSTAAHSYRQQIETRQQALRDTLAARHIQITSSVSTVLNAVFVRAPQDRVVEIERLPGVKGVVPMRRYRMKLNRATQLVNAQAAWNAFGGAQNAGAGMRIAIIDTGIDQTHPAFQDSSLKAPAGFPICNVPNCAAYTNNKVIVARSYVPILAAPTDPNNPAADSRPDDYSPRDREGHGTATASCAAAVSTITPALLTISGVAPKAFLGNYKIFGSPGVNDSAPDEAIIQALEDALNDHMDVASLSIGAPALTGPLDTGAACGKKDGVPCDLVPPVVEAVVKAGMVVVIAAGNDGDGQESVNSPVFNTIESPGDAPSAITVGATTNSHFMVEGIEVPGPGVPSNLQLLNGRFGDGPAPIGAVGAPLVDVTQLGDSGLACAGIPAGYLNGAFALIQRGGCTFTAKVTNAQNAGAQGVIFYMADQSSPISPAGLSSTNIPAIMVSNSDGLALKSYIKANAGHMVFIDAAAFEQAKPLFNQLAFFSSLGPSTGDNALKPDIVAVGGSDGFFSDMYLPAQNYDVQGILYSANRFAAGSGTSFSTPLVAGAAALVKQAHPKFTPAQIKSALVNTASQDVSSDEQNNPIGVQSLGGGKLDVNAAVQTTITVNPPSISFGLANPLPANTQLTIVNSGSSSVNLSLAVAPNSSAASANVTLNTNTLTLAPGASGSVVVTLSGSQPAPGSYSGAITIQGGSVPLRVPYLFLSGSGVTDNLTAISGDGFDGTVGRGIQDGVIAVKLIDRFGVPVSGAKVAFSAAVGGGALQIADTQTNANGIATAVPILGSQPGKYDFQATGDGLAWDFTGSARVAPSIFPSGITNAASFEGGKSVAPGSYISIFGAGLSDVTDSASTAILPLNLDLAMVSFDVPAAKISVPAHMIYVSPGQLNVQVPWELQGQTQALVKVTIDFSYGNVYTLALSDFSPAFYEIGGGNVAARDQNGGAIGTSNPAKSGQRLQLFANGLGPVTNQPASGDPAPASPFSTCKSPAAVTIGGKSAAIEFCGLAPGFPGLYQLDVVVPAGLTSGANGVTVTIGSQTSKASSLIVQ